MQFSELTTLWLKSLHVIFMVTWFSGLFYLPRLFVYHAMSDDDTSNERFKIMERKLYYGITYPGGILTTLLGLMLLYAMPQLLKLSWIYIKFFMVALLWGYHLLCGKYMKQFKENKNKHSHVFYRWFNEFPVIVLFVVIPLALIMPSIS